MKTKLTGYNLLYIYNVLQNELRISNSPKSHKKECIRIMTIIAMELNKLKIEIKE